ncbi:hypothetical protein, partial [Azospirillum oryzae]
AAGLPAILLLLIGAIDAQGLLVEGSAGRSPTTTTAAAGLPAILLLLIGAIDAQGLLVEGSAPGARPAPPPRRPTGSARLASPTCCRSATYLQFIHYAPTP